MRPRPHAAIRAGAALVVAAGMLVGVAGTAQACSCAAGDPRDRLADAPAAFVGELLLRDGDDLVFAVTTPVKGDLGAEIRIRSPEDTGGGACGLETPPGRRVGLLLYQGEDGALSANLCTTIDPDELLRAAGPLPEPDGRGSVRFLVGGSFGTARLLALDDRGRTLAYGAGDGYALQVAACPGGRFAMEVAVDGTAGMKGGAVTLAVRDLTTLRVVREVPLPGEARDARALECRDAGARSALLATRAGLLAVDGDRVSTLYPGSFDDADLSHDTAYGLDHGQLIAVEPGTGAVRVIATVPRRFGGLAVSPDGTRIAGTWSTYPTEAPMSVVIADLPDDPAALTFRHAELEGWNEGGDAVWIDDDRLAYLPGGGDHEVAHVYAADTLHELGSFDGWYTSSSAIVDGQAVGVGWGVMFRAALPNGPSERLGRLESPDTFAFDTVVGDVRVQPTPPPDPPEGGVILTSPPTAGIGRLPTLAGGALVLLVGLLAIAARRATTRRRAAAGER